MTFILSSTFVFANESTFKSWKTFQSDYGFEFKYPECWKVRSDDIDGKGSITQHAGVFVTEAGNCKTPRKQKWADNGISFIPIEERIKYTDIIHSIQTSEKSAEYKIKSGTWIGFKRFKIIGDIEVVGYVEKQNFVRWNYKIYCKS